MNAIDTLKKEIAEIELQAGSLNPEDYKALYKLLVVAYHKVKDINGHMEKANPAPLGSKDDNTNWKELVESLESTITTLTEQRDNLDGEVSEKQMALDLLVKENATLAQNAADDKASAVELAQQIIAL